MLSGHSIGGSDGNKANEKLSLGLVSFFINWLFINTKHINVASCTSGLCYKPLMASFRCFLMNLHDHPFSHTKIGSAKEAMGNCVQKFVSSWIRGVSFWVTQSLTPLGVKSIIHPPNKGARKIKLKNLAEFACLMQLRLRLTYEYIETCIL